MYAARKKDTTVFGKHEFVSLHNSVIHQKVPLSQLNGSNFVRLREDPSVIVVANVAHLPADEGRKDWS